VYKTGKGEKPQHKSILRLLLGAWDVVIGMKSQRGDELFEITQQRGEEKKLCFKTLGDLAVQRDLVEKSLTY